MRFHSLTPTCLMSMSFLVGWLTATGTGTGTGTWAWTSPNLPKAKAKAKANFHLSDAAVSRQDALKTLGSAASAAAAAALLVFSPTPSARAQAETLTLPSGVTYEVVKSGDGPKPEVGELIAIRFAAFCGPNKIDDIFETPEPYYTRLGSGGLLKGVETTLPLMRLGDRWKLTIPSDLAFGKKGRPASAGKPRIPGDAEVIFDVEIVGLPGKEPELIELIGDD